MHRISAILTRTTSTALLWAAAGAGPLAAQGVTTGAISGRVTDAAGNPIVDARIEARHEGTGAVASVATDAAGRFQIDNLRPGGPYTLIASRIGFQTVERGDLGLRLGQRLSVEIELSQTAVAVPEISIRVESDPQFDPSRMGAAAIVDRPALERLPTISRDFTEFAQLSPLVKVDEEGVSVAGANLRFNNIQIDGALNQDVFGLSPSGVAGGQARGRVIPLSAIEELQVLVAPFDVRQSGFTGGVLNAVTRTGTNDWQGSAFGSYRDDTFLGDLRIGQATRSPGDLENLFAGLDFGGPLIRDRLHVFAAAEVERRRRPPDGFIVGLDAPALTQLVPDSVQRLSDLLGAHGVDAGDGRALTLENDLANVFVRIDGRIDDANSVMLRYNHAAADDDPPPNRLPGDAYELSSAGTRVESRNRSVVGQWLSRFSDRVSNDLLVNVQFLRDLETPRADFPRVEIDVTGSIDGDALERQVRAGADLLSHASELDQDIVQVTDALTFGLANHQLTVGGSFERFSIRRLFLPGSLGSFRFASLADLAANLPSQYDVNLPLAEGPADVRFAINQFSAFVQDEARFGDALNVRLGVRIDVPTTPDSPGSNVDVEGLYGIDTGAIPSANALFSPRFGFNLKLGEARNTQIRGGAGLFAGRPPFAWLSNAYQNTGLRTGFLTCTGDNVPGFDGLTTPTTCLDGQGVESTVPVINAFDPGFRFPQDFKASLAVDQRFGDGWVVSLEGVFTRAVNQIYLEDLNIGPGVPAEERIDENGFSQGFGFGQRQSFGVPGRGIRFDIPGVADAEPPFFPTRVSADYGQVIFASNRSDNFAYAVSARVRKQFGARVALDGGYSFNRSADIQSLFSLDATTNFGATAIEGDPNEPGRQPSLFDRPHKVVFGATALLFERLGGTRISLLYVGQSGQPYSYVYVGDVNADAYPGSGQALDLSNDLIYVPDSFGLFPGGGVSGILFEQLVSQEPCLQRARLRVLSRNACRAPFSHQLDLRLTQDLEAGGATIQVVLDVLNVLNLLNGDWGHVQTVNPVVELLHADTRIEDDPADPFGVPEPDDPLQARYAGPIGRGDTGGFRALRPFLPQIGPSQWQAQLGFRVSFGGRR